ncbi:hypothetical protein KLP28_00650 [Nocardioidaceae bacterium]|nr:hypothetical protein KLP28_00650 [Nocardioidaceae bacterium]
MPPDRSLGGGGSREGDLPTLPDAEQGELIGQFVNFALRPDTQAAGTVDFADEVDLGLGTEVRRTLSGSDLGNPRRWLLPTEGYAGRDRFLSALRQVTQQAQRALREQQDTGIFVTVAGEHDQCAADPTAPLEGYDVDQQLAVMPGARSIESCAQWFAVDLYTDDAGDIAAVRLDLVGP